MAAAGRSTSSVDTDLSSAGAVGKKSSTQSMDSPDGRISAKIAAAGFISRTNNQVSDASLDSNISNLPNNTTKRMTSLKQQSDLESRINEKMNNAVVSTRSTSTGVDPSMMDRNVNNTSNASMLSASSSFSMDSQSSRSFDLNNDRSVRGFEMPHSGSSRNMSTNSFGKPSNRLSRQRISSLAITCEDDSEVNVFGEKVCLNSIQEDRPNETFNNNVMVRNNSSSPNELHTQYPNIEVSQTSLRTNSGYLSTTSADIGDEQHQRTLATALHYANFETNPHEKKWEKEDHPYFRIKALAFLIFTAGAIAGLFIGLRARNRNSSRGVIDAVPTPVPTSPRADVLPQMRNFLLPYTNASALEDSSSPQYQALNWLVFDDATVLEPNVNDNTNHQILQRYSLMTTYFTFPDSQLKSLNWGSSSSECKWQRVNCETLKGNIFNQSSLVDTVTSLRLFKLYLKGTFPNETGLLSNLGMYMLMFQSFSS